MLYSIGHSNRSMEDFLDLLQHFDINVIADIRSMPGSNKYPHFDQENLQVELPKNKIEYMHLPHLGGRRRKVKDADPIISSGWNAGRNNYADYAYYSDEFKDSLQTLIDLGSTGNVAFMCSEAVPWRCHRAVTTDWLILYKGQEVKHIISKGKPLEGMIHKHGILHENKVIYPTYHPVTGKEITPKKSTA